MTEHDEQDQGTTADAETITPEAPPAPAPMMGLDPWRGVSDLELEFESPEEEE